MVTVTADCRRVGEWTLVECRLTNDRGVPVRVRLESRLDGPTWPPRDDGHPDRGWTEEAWNGRLDASETVGVGFASPAEPVASPVTVEAERCETDPVTTPDGRFGSAPTPTDVARELTDPRPPLAGVVGASGESKTRPASDDGEPATTAAWLDEVTHRVERLEALAAARTLPDATGAVAEVGGLDGVDDLCDVTDDDRERLLELVGRAERLVGRIEAADVPVETLARLA
jgi:hypothetical protein